MICLFCSVLSLQTVKNYVNEVKYYQVSHGCNNCRLADHEVQKPWELSFKKLPTVPNQKRPVRTHDALRGIYQRMDRNNSLLVASWATFLVALYRVLRKYVTMCYMPESAASFDEQQHQSFLEWWWYSPWMMMILSLLHLRRWRIINLKTEEYQLHCVISWVRLCALFWLCLTCFLVSQLQCLPMALYLPVRGHSLHWRMPPGLFICMSLYWKAGFNPGFFRS